MNKLSIETIYDEYHLKVFSYINAKIKNQTEAEDITSDVFVKVISSLETYDDTKAQFSTWIYTIANNAVRDYLRRVSVKNKYSCDNSEVFLESVISDEESVDEKLFKEESLDLLADALEVLSERERLIVVLHYYKNVSHKDIALQLSLTYANVRYINHQAIKKIKTFFKAHSYIC